MKEPMFDPEGWAEIASHEADRTIRIARTTLYLIAGIFGGAIGASAYYQLHLGWLVLSAFVGIALIIDFVVLPVLGQLEAGRSYLEQAETIAYRHRNDLLH